MTIEQNDNVENVALYAVHPFPLFGLNFTHELPFANGTADCGGNNLDVATNTYARRLFHNPINSSTAQGGPSIGEWQEGPQAARLGMAGEAAAAVQLRAGWAGTGTGPYNRSHDGVSDHQMRFPGFFGRLASDENYFPDPEHLATMRTTLQWQILQNDGHRILLFGALPRAWDVEFKLHARYHTIVEGKCVDGRLVYLHVEPEERRKDVVILGDSCRQTKSNY